MVQLTKHPHWQAVVSVAEKLSSHGFDAVLAGGCVRDALLNIAPKDFDLATNARPEVVEKLFTRSIPVGKQFGVIIIPFDGFQIEVATFRRDLEYSDGRRPTEVVFCTREEDAARRDFTINALFYDLQTKKVIDSVGGIEDLKRQKIRAVGEPLERFGEDKLRMFRAVRFVAQLDFQIEERTLAAVKAMSAEIKVVSTERIRDEMTKLLLGKARVKALRLLEQTGLLLRLFPEIAATINQNPDDQTPLLLLKPHISLWEQTLAVLEQSKSQNSHLLWGLFFLNWVKSLGLEMAAPDLGHRLEKRFLELKLARHEQRLLTQALADYRKMALQSQWRLSEFKRFFAQSCAPLLLDLYRCDSAWVLGHERSAKWYESEARKHLGPELKLPEAFLKGADLKALGLSPGPQFGRVLEHAFDLQLEGELRSRGDALEWLKENVQL